MKELCSTLEEGLGHLIRNAEANSLGLDKSSAVVDLTAALTTVKTFLHWLGVKSSGECTIPWTRSRPLLIDHLAYPALASPLTANLTNLAVTVRDPSTALASVVIELRVAQLQAVDDGDRLAAIENLAASWLVFYGTCLAQCASGPVLPRPCWPISDFSFSQTAANDVSRLTAALQAFSKVLTAAERTAVVQSFIATAISPSAPAKLAEAALAGANHIFGEGAERAFSRLLDRLFMRTDACHLIASLEPADCDRSARRRPSADQQPG